MNTEEWKGIPDFICYEASTEGRIKNVIYRGGTANKARDKILKPRYDKHGYLYLALGKGIYRKVHRLVTLTFLPNPENKPQVNHKNGKKDDNRLENLEWATGSENSKHAFATGLSSSPTAILTPQLVIKIRELLVQPNANGAAIGRMFGVSRYTVSDIKRGKSWAHVTK